MQCLGWGRVSREETNGESTPMLGCPMDKGFNLLQSQSLPMAMVIDQGESTI
jgi:hypothetical protein